MTQLERLQAKAKLLREFLGDRLDALTKLRCERDGQIRSELEVINGVTCDVVQLAHAAADHRAEAERHRLCAERLEGEAASARALLECKQEDLANLRAWWRNHMRRQVDGRVRRKRGELERTEARIRRCEAERVARAAAEERRKAEAADLSERRHEAGARLALLVGMIQAGR